MFGMSSLCDKTSTMNITLSADSEQLLSSEVHIGITIFLTIVHVLGSLENSAVILVFFKNRHLKKPCNLYITGLAICDFLHCTIGMPMVTASAYARKWIFHQKGCIYYGFITTFLGITQIYILAIVAVDRYKSVRVGYTSKYKSDIKRCVILLVACYCHGLIWAIFPLAGWSYFQTYTAHLSCCINWMSKAPLDISYLLCLTLLGYIIPVVCIAYSYCGIYLMIRRKASMTFRGNVSATDKMFVLEKYIAITTFLVIVCFLLSWTPYAIVSIVSALRYPNSISTLGTTLPGFFAKSSTVWNPIIYVTRNGEFRRSLKLTLFRMPCRTKGASRSRVPCSKTISNDSPLKLLFTSVENIPLKPLKDEGIFTITCPEQHSVLRKKHSEPVTLLCVRTI